MSTATETNLNVKCSIPRTDWDADQVIRVPAVEISRNCYEISVPGDFVPHVRAGIAGRWVLAQGHRDPDGNRRYHNYD